jgi:hypothetical protein
MDGLNALIAAIKELPNLSSLNLDGNAIGGYNDGRGFHHSTPEGPKAIAAALPHCPNLQSLSLDSNFLCGVNEGGYGTFTTVGITALSEGIKQCKTLVSLSLDNNFLGSLGITELAKWLPECKALVSLSLANNLICYEGKMEGLNALITAIKQLPNLSSLNVRGSGINDDGKSALLAARPGLDLQL